MKKIRLGIVGARSLIAKELMNWLKKWHVPCEDIALFDAQEASGYICPFADHYLPIQCATLEDLCKQDVLMFCEESLRDLFYEKLVDTIYTIDLCNSQKDAWVVLPNWNIDTLLEGHKHIAIPNASLHMITAISKVIESLSELTGITSTTLHSAGEYGEQGCKELQKQMEAYLANKDLESCCFPLPTSYQHLPLLFQTLPQTSSFLVDGRSQEEAYLETSLGYFLKQVPSLSLTCARCASMRGMSCSITIELAKEICLETIVDAYASSSSFICFDDLSHDMYPITADVIHDYRIFIGRMRKSSPTTFMAWAVCDDFSIRCAAAVQVLFYLAHNGFTK